MPSGTRSTQQSLVSSCLGEDGMILREDPELTLEVGGLSRNDRTDSGH